VDEAVAKLDKWAKLLLDTGKRNNLINFRDTKLQTVEALLPSPDELFEEINNGAVLEVFDSKNAKYDEDEDLVDDNLPLLVENTPTQSYQSEKDEYRARYSSKLKQNQIFLYNTSSKAITAARNISKKARVLFNWTESDSAKLSYAAPVLLVPIKITQASAIDPCYIGSTDDDVVINPTFSYKLNAEYGKELPDFNDEDLSDYLQKVRDIVSKMQWTVTPECKIGIFSFQKINMYRDLKDNAASILANPNVRQLLGEPSIGGNIGNLLDNNQIKVDNPLIQLRNVVDADSSQMDAIEMAKSGKSFVLQGPPGTGKSQTITNIIAECLYDGKKVLFVSEKLAALNVVYEKLKQADLADFCLELHSHKSSKKEVIAELCRTLKAPKSKVSSKADTEIAIKKRTINQLDSYESELHQVRPVIDKSLYQLYDSYYALKEMPDVIWAVPQLDTKGDAYLRETSELLDQYARYIGSIGYDYKRNPWYGYISPDTSYQFKNQLKTDIARVIPPLDTLVQIQDELSAKYEIKCRNFEEMKCWKNFFEYASTSPIIKSSLLDKGNLDTVRTSVKYLAKKSEELLNARSILSNVVTDDAYSLDCAKYHEALVSQFSKLTSRLFNSEYKSIIKDLSNCKRNGAKPSYDEAVELTNRVIYCQNLTDEFNSKVEPVRSSIDAL
jgi:hypothetical protein